MSMRTSMALRERGIETLGGGRKKDTRKCANPGTQLHCYGKQKKLTLFEMRTSQVPTTHSQEMKSGGEPV